jgi:hypothetical protein
VPTCPPPLRARLNRKPVGGIKGRAAFNRLFTEGTSEMAQNVTTTCDRCSAVILEQRSKLTIEGGPLRQSHGSPVIDLCSDCQRAFSGWLRSREAADFVREPELAAAS